jgi:hypothetical protein
MQPKMLQTLACVGAALCIGVQAAPPVSDNAFNPALSLVLDGRFSNFDQDPASYELPGFQAGPETGPGEPGFALGEAELIISANVDDQFYGNLVAAIVEEDGEGVIELEEAWIQTLALPAGFTIKAGKFFSRIGYLNEKHPHAHDFADVPLVYRALLANNLKDTGLQVRWVAPTELYLELGVEALRGDAFPAGGAADEGKGTTTAFVKLGGDVGVSHSWQVGASMVSAEAVARSSEAYDDPSGTPQPEFAFTGSSDLVGLDLVWKWAPDGNYKQRNLKLLAEWMQRDEDGVIDTDFGGGAETGSYSGEQSGWFVQGVYQFMPRWRIGLRLDQLAADNAVAGLTGSLVLDRDGHDPKRSSVMIDFSNSEFSRLRLQFNVDDSYPGGDSSLVLQYIVSLGPHGAHQY